MNQSWLDLLEYGSNQLAVTITQTTILYEFTDLCAGNNLDGAKTPMTSTFYNILRVKEYITECCTFVNIKPYAGLKVFNKNLILPATILGLNPPSWPWE